MNSPSNDRAWYLVYTKPRSEQIALTHLTEQGYEAYLPLFHNRKRKAGKNTVVITALFPCYMFIRLNDSTDNWAPIRSTPGVSRLVRFGLLPAKVPDVFVEALKVKENAFGLHAVAPSALKTGDRVRVLDGPMAGLEAVYNTARGSDRAMVLLEILGKITRVELEVENLEKT